MKEFTTNYLHNIDNDLVFRVLVMSEGTTSCFSYEINDKALLKKNEPVPLFLLNKQNIFHQNLGHPFQSCLNLKHFFYLFIF